MLSVGWWASASFNKKPAHGAIDNLSSLREDDHDDGSAVMIGHDYEGDLDSHDNDDYHCC